MEVYCARCGEELTQTEDAKIKVEPCQYCFDKAVDIVQALVDGLEDELDEKPKV